MTIQKFDMIVAIKTGVTSRDPVSWNHLKLKFTLNIRLSPLIPPSFNEPQFHEVSLLKGDLEIFKETPLNFKEGKDLI